VREIGRGQKVFDAGVVRGTLRVLESPDDVLELMDLMDAGDAGAEGVVALVRDAGATFLGPLFHDLAGVICTGGTMRSHVGIVSREFGVPCVMGCTLTVEPVDGAPVELDCTGGDGVVRSDD